MRVRCNIAERSQERAASEAEQLAQAVEAGQLFRVHLHFDRFDAGRGVEAHGFLLGVADYEDGHTAGVVQIGWVIPVVLDCCFHTNNFCERNHPWT